MLCDVQFDRRLSSCHVIPLVCIARVPTLLKSAEVGIFWCAYRFGPRGRTQSERSWRWVNIRWNFVDSFQSVWFSSWEFLGETLSDEYSMTMEMVSVAVLQKVSLFGMFSTGQYDVSDVWKWSSMPKTCFLEFYRWVLVCESLLVFHVEVFRTRHIDLRMTGSGFCVNNDKRWVRWGWIQLTSMKWLMFWSGVPCQIITGDWSMNVSSIDWCLRHTCERVSDFRMHYTDQQNVVACVQLFELVCSRRNSDCWPQPANWNTADYRLGDYCVFRESTLFTRPERIRLMAFITVCRQSGICT